MVDPDRHWDLYTLCDATQWAVLPREGGWENQDDAFLHDMGIITRRIAYLRKIEKINKKRRDQIKKIIRP
jgi:hypothetical protein